MNHTLEYSVEIQCDPQALYAVYSDVARWHEWDPDTRAAHLNGPLRVGAIGRLKPRKGMAVKMVVTMLEPGRRFDVHCPVLGCVMHFNHIIESLDSSPHGATVRATHRVRFEGWLAGFLYRVVGKDLHHGLPITLQRLKAYVEGGAAQPAAPRPEN